MKTISKVRQWLQNSRIAQLCMVLHKTCSSLSYSWLTNKLAYP